MSLANTMFDETVFENPLDRTNFKIYMFAVDMFNRHPEISFNRHYENIMKGIKEELIKRGING